MRPWVCPKCGRVWAGYVSQCVPCNHAVSNNLNYGGWTPPIKRASIEMTRR